jgi:hypothetical protein
MDDRYIELTKEDTFKVTKNTMEVQYVCNGYPIVRQFLLPFNEVYNHINSEFSSEVMRKNKNWFTDNIYIFISFTIRDNIILNKLPYEKSKNLDNAEKINDRSYINLFSYTYKLGRKNVIEMYKSFLDMTKKYNIVVGKIAYTKVHRLNNLLDKVNLIDSNKFIKILERGV